MTMIEAMIAGYFSHDAVAANDDRLTSSVHGRVVLVGPLPVSEPRIVYRDSAVCGETILDEKISVNPDTRGIAGVVVSLEGVQVPTPSAPRNIIVESDHCRFLPRVTATTTTSTVTFRNTDPILHDAQVVKPNTLNPIRLNVLQPPHAPDVMKSLSERGVLIVRCNVHAFMRGSILVFDHPYFAISDTTGDFILPEVPAGTYKLRLWHETLGVTEKVLTVKDGERANIMVELKKESSAPNYTTEIGDH